MTTHDLKTVPPYFSDVMSGIKTFEVRKNDRDYQVGDTLRLFEWDGERHTGNAVKAHVMYITDYMQQPGYVVLGIEVQR